MSNIIDNKPKTYGELCELDKKQNFGSLYDKQKTIYNYEDVLLSKQIMNEDKKRLIQYSTIDNNIQEMSINKSNKNQIKTMPGIGEVIQIM